MPLILTLPAAAPSLSVTFATPAPDDSGVAHVLEHMVFRGSRRFPRDQLYMDMRAGSLARHLNATTGAEATSYHIETPDPADLLRLAEILRDALLHPLLADHAFAEEAHGPQGAGVIVNEMIGHFARPQARREHLLRRALHGDHAAGRAYGGLPREIARLTPEALRAFHQTQYRADNALILLGGFTLDCPDGGGLRTPPPAPALRYASLSGGEGWVLPPAPPLVQALACDLILGAASHEAGSGLISDSARPTLLRFGRAPVNLARLVETLTREKVAHLWRRRQAVMRDDGRDPRLPAAFHNRATLIGQWLQGRDPREISPEPELQSLHDNLAALMLDMHNAPRVEASEIAMDFGYSSRNDTGDPPVATGAIPPARTAGICHETPAPLIAKPLPELDISALPQDPPSLPACIAGRLSSLPPVPPNDAIGQWHLAFDASDCSALELAALTAALPLLQQACADWPARIGFGIADWAALSLSLTCPADAVSDLLGRMHEILAKPLPMGATPRPRPLHLAMELRLQAAFSPDWARVDAAQGLGLLQNAPAQAPQIISRARCFVASFNGLTPDLPAGEAIGPQAILPPAPQHEIICRDAPLYHQGIALHLPQLPRVHLAVALAAIEAGWLWPQLRVAGGAYGIRTTRSAAIATLWSARDPHCSRSLDIMRDSGRWLAKHADPDRLNASRLPVFGAILARPTRASALELALTRRHQPWTTADLALLRQMTPEDLAAAGRAIDKAMTDAKTLVIGDSASLKRAGLQATGD